ncbi:MAG: hypothetical protein M3337_00300 [Actinomycetota bacterium]|nr:hypothetical protein [Actinomycetota bacterium]
MSISDDQSGEPRQPTTDVDDDWDVGDESVVKVHYDLSAWRLDQRAEATEAFAEAEIPHHWDGDEIVIPETSEKSADAVFEALEAEFGPFAILLGEGEESVEFGLDEWPERDRESLRRAVTDAEIPHRWDGTTIVVARDAEGEVDALLDAIEAGELVDLGDGDGPPEGTLGDLFSVADRLAREPLDEEAHAELDALTEVLDADQPPYGVGSRVWATAVDAANRLADRGDDDDPDPSDMIGIAQELRTIVRPYV